MDKKIKLAVDQIKTPPELKSNMTQLLVEQLGAKEGNLLKQEKEKRYIVEVNHKKTSWRGGMKIAVCVALVVGVFFWGMLVLNGQEERGNVANEATPTPTMPPVQAVTPYVNEKSPSVIPFKNIAIYKGKVYGNEKPEAYDVEFYGESNYIKLPVESDSFYIYKDYIYYLDYYNLVGMSEDHVTSLRRCRLDGSEDILIKDDLECTQAILVENKIYVYPKNKYGRYVYPKDTVGVYFAIDIDTLESQQVKVSEDFICILYGDKENLYYTLNNNRLVKRNLQTNEEKTIYTLEERIIETYILGTDLYVNVSISNSEENRLIRINLEDTKEIKEYSFRFDWHAFLYDETIYYGKDNSIYACDLEGNNQRVIYQDEEGRTKPFIMDCYQNKMKFTMYDEGIVDDTMNTTTIQLDLDTQKATVLGRSFES